MVFREMIAFSPPRVMAQLRRATCGSIAEASRPSQQDTGTVESPPLLLEGDEFFVAHDGITRSYYELNGRSTIAVEELYDLQSASKEFVLRNPSKTSTQKCTIPAVLGPKAEGVVPMGKILSSIKLQEIDGHLFGLAGTGATTWEASIAMGLYFHSNPEQLFGHVVEVGCGVGLGGLLINRIRQMSTLGDCWSSVGSLTLTDGNERVIEQCRLNIENTTAGETLRTDLTTCLLDWRDFSQNKNKHLMGLYSTVVACDCAYLHSHTKALGDTLFGLLDKTSPRATIHIFGPYNRSAFDELIEYIKDEFRMELDIDWIEMERYRLKPRRRMLESIGLADGVYASKSTAKFMHVRATITASNANTKTTSRHFSDID